MFLLLLTACRQKTPKPTPPKDNPSRSPDADLRLTVTIVRQPRSPQLNVTLTNISPRTLAIVTGADVGGTIYPAADLQYSLLNSGGTRSQVDCRGCQAAYIFGSVGPYSIFLNPAEQKTFTLDLSDLYILQQGTEHTLGVGKDPGATLTVSLQGLSTEPASWLGFAEGTIALP